LIKLIGELKTENWRLRKRLPPEIIMERKPPPDLLVPLAEHGDPTCPGLILPEPRGELTDLVCNDCGVIIATVPTSEDNRRLAEMATKSFCSETCPYCGKLNIFPGFEAMLAYRCRFCGGGVKVDRLVH
jgi:hypothetical protein